MEFALSFPEYAESFVRLNLAARCAALLLLLPMSW
jgi:hypothetical protein